MSADADVQAALVLSTLSDLGPRRLYALLASGSAETALRLLRERRWNDLPAQMRECAGVHLELLERWARQLQRVDGEAVLRCHLDAHVEVIGPTAIAASEPWAHDPEPPAVLFLRGRPVDMTQPRVAIVGTRRCTAYGRSVASELAADLARAGVAVVSGVAAGIDGVAQRAALDAGGYVVGVVGTGLDQVYPRVNAELWHRLAAHGTLLGEYPLGTPPAKWHFPARNRLIAALSDVVVVIESPERGGSMYTVDAALERDRLVMAVPGPVTSRTSEGPNRLLAEGAGVARDAADVLVALGHMAPASPRRTDHGDPPDAVVAAHVAVLDALGWEAATVDELMLRAAADLTVISVALRELQAHGIVEETGGWWERVRR